MGWPVVSVASGGLPVVEVAAPWGTPVTEAANGRGAPVTKVIGKPGLPVRFESIGGGDAAFANVTLLLGFDGANGAASGPGMTDESPAACGVAQALGTGTIETAQFKIGSSSFHFTSASTVRYAARGAHDLGAVPFTVEAWIYPATVTGNQAIVCKWGTAAPNLGWMLFLANAVLTLNVSTTGSDIIAQLSGGTVATNTWQSVCADFDGSKYRLYLNGVMVGSSTVLRTIFSPSAKGLSIGSNYDAALFFTGWIDEVRLTKGTARYASDAGYVVSTTRFPRA